MRRTHVQSLIFSTIAMAGMAFGQTPPTQPPPTDPPPTTPPPTPAAPQPGGSVVVGTQTQSWKSVELLQFKSAVEFRYQYQQDTLSSVGQETQKTTETRFRETVDLSAETAIGHKNLVDFNGSAQLGREDILTSSSIGGTSDHEVDDVNLFDLNALIMGTSFLPTNVYARREQNQLNRPFVSTINETITEEGISSRIQSSIIPTSVQYLHREDQTKGDFGNTNTTVKQDTLTLQSRVSLTASQKLEAGVVYDKIAESQAGGYTDSYTRQDVNIVHIYSFGKESRPDELRSSLRTYDQSGKRTQKRVRLDEVLTLRHSDRLETRYDATADRQDVNGDVQQLNRADASIRYRLFDSLTSLGTIGAQQLSAPGGFTSDELFTNGELDYTKVVPYGRLEASVGAGYNAQSNSERGSSTRVNNETHTFVDGFAIILARRNIVAGSVVVTPAAGFPLFMEGTDYTLSIFADHAEIRGVVGGGISNGQSLLVSYDVGPEQSSDIDTMTTGTSVRYTISEGWLDGIALYSTYRTIGHSVRAKDPAQFVVDDTNDLLMGVQYQIAEYAFKYEYNIHDSTLDPYNVHRLQAVYTLPLGPNSTLGAELTREMIDFVRQGYQVTFDRGSLRWNHRLGRDLDINVRIEYRNENNSRNGESTGLDESLGFTYGKRKTTIYGSLRNSQLDGPSSQQTSQFLQFGFRRTF